MGIVIFIACCMITFARDTQKEKKPNQCVMKLPKKYKIMLVTLILTFDVSRVSIARFPADLLLKLCSAPSSVLFLSVIFITVLRQVFFSMLMQDVISV